MATFDAHANLALATVAVAPSPALSGTSLIITAGFASLFPATPFNATCWPATANPTDANAEIVRVTSIVGDIFTIVRAQEGTTAKAIASGYRIGNTVTAKVFTDIENQAIFSISAGTTNATGNQVVFSNSNGVSFGASNNIITASFSGGGGGGGGAAISAGANSQITGTVVFSNSNGVTFGLSNNGVMTASHNAITAQSTQPVAASASNGSFAFSTLGFSNANGVTFGTSAGSIITASVGTAAAGNSVNFSAGTTSNNLGSIVFSNSNGVTFGLDGSTITAQHDGLTSQSNQAFSAQGGSSAFQTLNFANSNGITFSNSGGSVVASHDGLTSQSNQAASASNGSFAFQTLGFSNANNVTFGTSAGSIITASVAAAGAGSVNFSAGTTSNNLASIVFSNSNGVSFGLNGSTITASAAGGTGAAARVSYFEPFTMVSTGNADFNNSVISLVRFNIPFEMSNAFARVLVSVLSNTSNIGSNATFASATAGLNQSYSGYLYSQGTGANSTNLELITSASALYRFENQLSITNGSQWTATRAATWQVGNGSSSASESYAVSSSVYNLTVTSALIASIGGVKFFDLPFGSPAITPGQYWLGMSHSSVATSAGDVSALINIRLRANSLSFVNQADIRTVMMGNNGTASDAHFMGAGSATADGATIALTNIGVQGTNRRLYFNLIGE
jgi:hypothetical protein